MNVGNNLCTFAHYFIYMVKVKIINKGHQQLPAYATPQSAGMDLRANIDATITLKPMERKLIPTGLFMALPEGYEAQVRPRSGLALKHGITVLNSPGTIQMVIARHETADFEQVEVLDDTERGEGGYGHTGI